MIILKIIKMVRDVTIEGVAVWRVAVKEDDSVFGTFALVIPSAACSRRKARALAKAALAVVAAGKWSRNDARLWVYTR